MALTSKDFATAARELGCEEAAVKAVAEVEAGKWGGFLPSGEPVILFERHLFHRLTQGRHDAAHPDISNPKPGGYGTVKEQHAKLQKAAALDRDAALQSCSWGLFQVLGKHWKLLGYSSLQAFVNSMYRSEADHLEAFVRFIRVNGLAKHLKSRDWSGFAERYNGKGYRKFNYDDRIATAYTSHKTRVVPAPALPTIDAT